MSLLMLLLTRAYAPLGARGALVDGLRPRSPVVDQASLRPRSAPCTPFPSNARRAAHSRTPHARNDRDSLAA